MIITVRQLSLADVDWAAAVLAATGLRARQPELRRYLALEPGGYCAAEADGRPVGLGGFAAYADLAFVGNMAVVPEMQGRGVGRAILHRMLEDIDRCGIPTTLLRFNGEYHGTGSKPSNFMRTQLYMMSWYQRWRLNAGTPASSQ